MSLRARVVAYLAVIHLLFGALAVYLLRESIAWLFAVELVFVVSLGVGIALSRRALQSLTFAADAARLISEDDLTSRFVEGGGTDVNALLAVYNRMVDRLREERTRVREQHHFFSQVIRASPSGLVVLDFDGRVSDLNPAAERLLGATREHAVGRSIASVSSPLAGPLAALAPHTSAVVGLTGPRRVKIQHGTFIDRGFARSFLVVQELTEELRQFERAAYEKLIRVMSHEVNNSVTAANSLLQSSLTYGSELSPASRDDFERALGIVIGRTEQLNLFMRRFADVYRLPPPLKAACDLHSIIEPIVRLLAARPEARHVQWRWEVAASPVAVTVDRGQIEQVCLNIVKNAVEAASPNGTVTIRVDTAAGRPSLEIEDSGAGLSAEAQENVFTPFFSTKPHGQGIGLTLVQEILTAHGCAYALESRPGGPTTFKVGFEPGR